MKILSLEQMNAVSGGAGHAPKPPKHCANHSAKASNKASHAASNMASSMAHAASSTVIIEM
jgi:ribosomal protein L4